MKTQKKVIQFPESLKFTQELNFVLDCDLPAPNENALSQRNVQNQEVGANRKPMAK